MIRPLAARAVGLRLLVPAHGAPVSTGPRPAAPKSEKRVDAITAQGRILHEKCPLKRGHLKVSAALRCALKVGDEELRLPGNRWIDLRPRPRR